MKNVLIVDDNDLVCRLVGRLSQRKDVTVTIARNGSDARRVLQGDRLFDLVFLDLMLPGISGWDILAEIRKADATKDMPVVILTGLSLSDQEIEKLQDNATAIIDKKTFNKTEFARLLRKLL